MIYVVILKMDMYMYNYFVYGVDYQIKINLGVLMIINKCDKFIILGDFYVI